MARNLLDAVARDEQVEIRLSPLDQGFTEDFAGGALARPFGGRVGSLGMSARVLLIWIDHTERSVFPQSIVWGASPNREGCFDSEKPVGEPRGQRSALR
jgi:hypothetical protein